MNKLHEGIVMVKKKKNKAPLVDENQIPLPMALPEKVATETETDEHELYATVEHPNIPIATEHKAKLIQRYLKYFCYVTYHGTYIDGFAGPQRLTNPEICSARLVLEQTPKRLKNFYLYDVEKNSVAELEKIKKTCLAQDLIDKAKRKIEVKRGDCNLLIPELLNSGLINKKEATFCLLDQRTFECHWSTVEALAKYEKSQYKIELFYFLAEGWLDRAFVATTKSIEKIEKWWGNENWTILKERKAKYRAKILCDRFSAELGYKFVKAHPIYFDQNRDRIQYFMIHATDHPAAPKLMKRAYRQAVRPDETPEQLELMFQEEGIDISGKVDP